MRVETILSELIKIDTSNPPGNETAVANYLATLFIEHGISCQVIEPAPGRGSLLARLGDGPRRLLFLSHTDVVPAGNDWDFPPFSGAIKDGYVLGRGALDCKNLVAAEAWTMLELARQGTPLHGTLLLVAAADEENGGHFGMEHLVQHHAADLAADFAVNEGAPEPIIVNDRPLYFIQVGEKGIAQASLTAAGKAAHSSVPTLGENAVVKTADAVLRLAAYQAPPALPPELRSLVDQLAQCLGLPAPAAGGLDSFLDRIADKGFREYLRALTRLTISPNIVSGGSRANVVPDRCQVEVDVRLLPGQSQAMIQQLLQTIAGAGMEVTFARYHAPSLSPAAGAGYELISAVLQQVTGAAACLPCFSTGATDSRFLRQLGIPAYGVSPWQPNFHPELRQAVHGSNERIDLDSLRLYAHFLHKLALAYLG